MFPSAIGKIFITFLLALFVAGESFSQEIPSQYQKTALEYGVPANVLYSIALNESGLALKSKSRRQKKVRPWPWTLNVAGMPRRYPSRKAAYQAIRYYLARGITLIDIGLMQVNWHYHKDKLIDPWTALDPVFNLKVGAAILKAEYRKTKDWVTAIGRYHSPGQKAHQKSRAKHYAGRVMKRLKRLHHKS
jgi:soluble lytic murein transglycosylase-like protein